MHVSNGRRAQREQVEAWADVTSEGHAEAAAAWCAGTTAMAGTTVPSIPCGSAFTA